MTADHLRAILESKIDSVLLAELGASVARVEAAPEVWEALRLGRLTAYRKPDGGVRGIVARIVSQQMATTVEALTSCFQYVLSTMAGTDHVLQTLTNLDARLTVLSIAGIGAFDLVSLNSMLRA